MSSVNVPSEIKVYVENLKLKVEQLTAENERLRLELQTRSTVVVASGRKVQTIQATGKIWKLLIVFGGLLLLTGIPAFGVGLSQNHEGATAYGLIAMVIGLPVLIAGRFGKFWFHG